MCTLMCILLHIVDCSNTMTEVDWVSRRKGRDICQWHRGRAELSGPENQCAQRNVRHAREFIFPMKRTIPVWKSLSILPVVLSHSTCYKREGHFWQYRSLLRDYRLFYVFLFVWQDASSQQLTLRHWYGIMFMMIENCLFRYETSQHMNLENVMDI